jgi:cell division protein FtsI/penicillin-binding protein 2
MLNRSFPSPRVEYLLLDLSTRETIAIRWPMAGTPVPAGSLLKPFVALAYAEMQMNASFSESAGSPAFPVVRCRGRGDGCWRKDGHGSMTLERAIAESCNAYFLALAAHVSASRADAGRGELALKTVSASYGLPLPPPAAFSAGTPAARSAQMLIGVTPEWRVAPLALAQAYATLAGGAGGEAAGRILSGMRLAALADGTAARIGMHPGGVLAKTGTARCVADLEPGSDHCLASGDGLVMVLAPAEHPHLLLLVRQRGTTGAQTSEVAGKMLSRIEETYATSR